MVQVRVKRWPGNDDIPLPRYMSPGAAGMDLYAAVTDPVLLNPGDIKLIPTGISIALPLGFEGQIRPRSGLALKHGVTLLNTPGTIDADYRGMVQVIMINLGKEPFEVKRGDRIAQLVISEVTTADLELVEELDDTERGDGGFGHTGI